MALPPHGAPDDPFTYTDREVEIADDCVAWAEAVLAARADEVAARLESSREASGVSQLLSRRSMADQLPRPIAEIAGGLLHHAHESRWPNWRDGIPKPPRRRCQSCETDFGYWFNRFWQWCPACGNRLDTAEAP